MIGAYGLALAGVDDARDLLVPAGESWPAWRVERETGDPGGGPPVGDGRATVPLYPAGRLDVDRDARLARFTTPEPMPGDHVAHPYLAPAAALAAHWLGHESFHAGAVVVDGRAWVVIGDKGDGKSSLLAALAMLGLPILSDDLVVVASDGRAFASPRCLDLREDAAAALAAGRPIGMVGGRERWRFGLGAVAAQVPVAGWVRPSWGSALEVGSVAPGDRLPALYGARALRIGLPAAATMMDLAALPMIAFARPRRLGEVLATAEGLVDAVRGLGKRNG